MTFVLHASHNSEGVALRPKKEGLWFYVYCRCLVLLPRLLGLKQSASNGNRRFWDVVVREAKEHRHAQISKLKGRGTTKMQLWTAEHIHITRYAERTVNT
eukprot:6213218-Pleurochrysis_carterae.AAC.2